jgi:mannose-6-phosphate isomerase
MPESAASLTSPLILSPIAVERVWGVTDLPPWYSLNTAGKTIGEVWLTAEECRVASGPLAGKTLKELAAEHPEAFGNADGAGFPLLLKIILPREKLSVQVHPDDAAAKSIGQPRGKTECWYVLEAEPDATVAVGFREPITLDGVKRAIEAGDLEDKLAYLPVQAGNMVFIDAGTVHAIGPGMVVLETQQYSDTTYRLYDYGRPRELHVEKGLGVSLTESKAGLVKPKEHTGFDRLVTSDYFVVDRFRLEPAETRTVSEANGLQILIALSEGVVATVGAGEPFTLPIGYAVLAPAGVETPAITIEAPGASPAEVIRVAQS